MKKPAKTTSIATRFAEKKLPPALKRKERNVFNDHLKVAVVEIFTQFFRSLQN
jgi:hypothetical protein